jgi:hypothetical protein
MKRLWSGQLQTDRQDRYNSFVYKFSYKRRKFLICNPWGKAIYYRILYRILPRSKHPPGFTELATCTWYEQRLPASIIVSQSVSQSASKWAVLSAAGLATWRYISNWRPVPVHVFTCLPQRAPWNRVAHMVEKFSSFTESEISLPCQNLSWASWIQSTHFHPISTTAIIFSCTPKSSERSLSFRFFNRNPVRISHLFHACYMPRPSHPPWFDDCNNI